MRDRNFLYLTLFVCLLAGLLGAVTAYRDMQKRELQDWKHREWVRDLVGQRRAEFQELKGNQL